MEGGGEPLIGASLACEHGEGAVECLLRYVVAMGPALPGREGADVEPVLAEGGHHRVEEVDGVPVAQLFVRIALNGGCLGVAFDGRGGSVPGAFEVELGSFELLLGDVDFVAEGAAVPARCCVESMLCRAVTPSCFRCSGLSVVQRVSIASGCGRHLSEVSVGACDCVGDSSPPHRLLRFPGFGVEQGALCFGEDGREPVGDRATRHDGRRRLGKLSRQRPREGAPLGGRGDVDTVDGEDGLEHVAGLGDVVAVGDDTERVLVAAASRSHVSARGGWSLAR